VTYKTPLLVVVRTAFGHILESFKKKATLMEWLLKLNH
jgi:hypothetical protein